MFKSLNPESLDIDDITSYVKRQRNGVYLANVSLERAIALETSKRKQENFNYKILLFVNLLLMLASLIGAVVTIINVFKGNWNYVAGYAILTYGTFWIFRRIPWPTTRLQRALDGIRRFTR